MTALAAAHNDLLYLAANNGGVTSLRLVASGRSVELGFHNLVFLGLQERIKQQLTMQRFTIILQYNTLLWLHMT